MIYYVRLGHYFEGRNYEATYRLKYSIVKIVGASIITNANPQSLLKVSEAYNAI
jgi:hypothetical protein